LSGASVQGVWVAPV
ncbi:MAG: hypothetical protein EZS28_046262, partial [Streblomastix strix]